MRDIDRLKVSTVKEALRKEWKDLEKTTTAEWKTRLKSTTLLHWRARKQTKYWMDSTQQTASSSKRLRGFSKNIQCLVFYFFTRATRICLIRRFTRVLHCTDCFLELLLHQWPVTHFTIINITYSQFYSQYRWDLQCCCPEFHLFVIFETILVTFLQTMENWQTLSWLADLHIKKEEEKKKLHADSDRNKKHMECKQLFHWNTFTND